MESADRGRVREAYEGTIEGSRGKEGQRQIGQVEDRCTSGEGDAGNVRYNDVGSFTVVRHFGTCFPINMHVLVP